MRLAHQFHEQLRRLPTHLVDCHADSCQQLRELGMVPAGGTPAEFAALIAAEGLRWAKVMKENQITLE